MRYQSIAVLLVLAAITLNAQEYYPSFTEFCSACQKSYVGNEKITREAIFDSNVTICQQINVQGLSWKCRVNCKFDLTGSELALPLLKVSPNIVWNTRPITSLTVGTASAVNWTLNGKTSPVKNQGTCGSCWTFSSTAHFESELNIAGLGMFDLSEQYVLECTSKYTNLTPISSCGGGIVDYAQDMIRNVGIPLETVYPYAASTFGGSHSFPSTISNCFGNTSANKIVKNADGTAITLLSKQNVTQATLQTMLNAGTVVGLIYADSGFQMLGAGTYSGCPPAFATSFAAINHAVEIIGYDTNGWIIKNSWGTGWGANGFGSVSYANDCALTGYVFQLQVTAGSANNTQPNNTNNSTILKKSWNSYMWSVVSVLFLMILI